MSATACRSSVRFAERRCLLESVLALVLLSSTPWGRAQEPPPATPAAAPQSAGDKKLELHEWSVWGISPNLDTANDETRYPSAMPVVVESARPAGRDDKKMEPLTPVTIMTFHGDPVADVDIAIRSSSGRIVSHWPRGTTSDRRTRWNHVDLLAQPPADQRYAMVTDDHWFNRARKLDTLYLKVGTRDERFVAYDPVVKWTLPLELTGGPDTFTLVNTGKVPLYDVAISVPAPDGRRVAWIDLLPAAAQPQAEEKPTGPALAATKSIDAHPGGASCLAISANGQLVATAGADLKIKVWQVSDAKLRATFEGHTGPITALAFIPNGDKLASVSHDKTLRLWNVAQGTPISTEALTDAGLTLGVSNDGKRLIAGSQDGKGLILDPAEGKVVAKAYSVHRENFQAVAVAPDRRLVVTGGGDKIGKLWNVVRNSYTAGAGTLKGHSGAVTGVAILPDSKTAITGSNDGTVRLWDLQARKETKSFRQPGPVA
ncbi:MAG: WD40 repeat domain-containing protein, partial [Planctomycetaceae bacterium]|nr:WD40 repeat domain-containing protein [Planctomycetaceae bacterium]